MILFNTANVDSFDKLTGFKRISRPGDLKAEMLATWPDQPLHIVYTPLDGDKLKHFELVCTVVKLVGEENRKRNIENAGIVLAVDEIDVFMTASDPGPQSFQDLFNYGRHLRVGMIATTRNTVAVSRQYTSMLTEICIFAMTEPRYLKYFEETCGAVVSDQVPLLGKHEYLRWMADGGLCERRKGWSK